jgi:hypothetical protein
MILAPGQKKKKNMKKLASGPKKTEPRAPDPRLHPEVLTHPQDGVKYEGGRKSDAGEDEAAVFLHPPDEALLQRRVPHLRKPGSSQTSLNGWSL